MYAEAVEESFHHNRAPRRFPHGTMEVKDHLRLAETRREQVSWLRTIQAAAGIGNQPALVDRKHDPIVQESGTGIIADTEPGRGGRGNRALVQVRMPAQAA